MTSKKSFSALGLGNRDRRASRSVEILRVAAEASAGSIANLESPPTREAVPMYASAQPLDFLAGRKMPPLRIGNYQRPSGVSGWTLVRHWGKYIEQTVLRLIHIVRLAGVLAALIQIAFISIGGLVGNALVAHGGYVSVRLVTDFIIRRTWKGLRA
ncbi:MAG: hypothetical protein ACLPRH_19030 [Syntrophobacteraceae bacterium]